MPIHEGPPERYRLVPLPGMKIEHRDNGLTPPVSIYSEKIVSVAFELLSTPGIRFRSEDKGMNPDEGTDCSGATKYAIEEVRKTYEIVQSTEGIRYANDFFDRYGTWVDPRYKLPGDLIFFSRDGISVSHMGIYIGDDTNGISHYIHSPGHDNSLVEMKAVIYTELHPAVKSPRFNVSPIGYKRPLLDLPEMKNGQIYGRPQFTTSIQEMGLVSLSNDLT